MEALHYQEYIVVAIVTYFTFLILYYYLEFSKIKSKYTYINTVDVATEIEAEEKTEPQTFIELKEENLESEQVAQKVLYQKIIDFLEIEKPYQKPDFNLKKLATILETNTTYVSRSLNIYGKKNFSTLVNEYRIAQIKEDLSQNMHIKFTLEYVYTRAGFSNQPTFNRVFKEQTGFTPSEYLEDQDSAMKSYATK